MQRVIAGSYLMQASKIERITHAFIFALQVICVAAPPKVWVTAWIPPKC